MGTALQTTQFDVTRSLSDYLSSINNIPVLSIREEQSLAKRLYEKNDLNAAKQLILSNLRFVVHVANTYEHYGLPKADLIQEGNIGLMKAVKRFNPDKGVRLITFAVHWIKAEIHEFILKNWKIVKVATTKAQRKLFFNLRRAKQHLGWLTRQETEAIAKDLNVSPKDVQEMEARLSLDDTTYDLHEDHNEDRPNKAASTFLATSQTNPGQLVEASNWQEKADEALSHALAKLDERSRYIIQARFLNEPKSTLQALADEFDISVERVRQIEKNGLAKIKCFLSDEDIA